jgi:type II secretory pathway predicted ATPase ExeA
MPDTIFSFFGLREDPFKINPDPRFIFLTERAEATLNELVYGISTRKGLILLAGEVGTGKTMLLRRLLDWLGEQKMPTALIFNSHINPDHLLDFILNDFGIACESNIKSDKLLSLNRWLLERYRAGQTPVLIVDEAQGLSPQALEEIRLLLNFETPRHKLLQVVLAGQPELEEKLKRYELRQLRQRITLRCRTAPLTPEETHGYLRERLRIAGGSGEPIFEPEAVASVHAYAQGIPRVINVLCDHALVNSCAEGCKTVSARSVAQAARECHLDQAESIARILSSGSYARAGLADAASILAAASGASTVVAPAGPERHYLPPARWWPALPLTEHIADVPMARVNVPVEASFSQSPTGTGAASTVSRELPTPSLTRQPESFDDREEPPSSSQTELASRNFSGRDHFTLQASLSAVRRVWRSWQESFFSEARLVWRQTRRKFRSAETHYWKPFLRDARHGFYRLQSSAGRFASDPRWQELTNRCALQMRAAWRHGKATMQAGLAGIFGAAPRQASNSAPPSRANRRRSMASLKRWLHEPLSRDRRRAASSGQSRTSGL